jgi:hypothetical protein
MAVCLHCLVTFVTLQSMYELNTGSTAAILRDQAGNEPSDSDEGRAKFNVAHSPSPSMLPQSSTPAPAEEQAKWQSDPQVDLGYELKSAVDSMLQAFPKYIGFIVYSHSSFMPVGPPPVSKVYQDQMTTLFHGLALWNPNPPKEIYDKVSIGDVGYLHEGCFIRMFNVMLPWSHESNRTLGQPELYEPLDCSPFANTLKRQFDGVKHCSRYVSAETNAGNREAKIPDE